jgi:hypothetical protein
LASFLIRVFHSEAVCVDSTCNLEKESKEAHSILVGRLWEGGTWKTKETAVKKVGADTVKDVSGVTNHQAW